jgi:hypothetical protein
MAQFWGGGGCWKDLENNAGVLIFSKNLPVTFLIVRRIE